MKKLLVLSLAACMFTLASTAQTERPTETKPKTERHKGKHERGMMMKELNLSKEQQAKMKANHQEMKAKHDALKGQDNITVKEMKERKAALKAEQEQKNGIYPYTGAKTKMDEMRKKRIAERGENGEKRKGKGHKKGNQLGSPTMPATEPVAK